MARTPRPWKTSPACRAPKVLSWAPSLLRSPSQEARRAGPRLCHRQAQERGGARLDQAGRGQDHRQRQGLRAQYFARPVLQMLLRQPLQAANRLDQFDIMATVGGRRSLGPGRRGAARHLQGAHLLRAGAAGRAQEGRLPHARQSCGRAQEVRPHEGPPQLPVLEALIRACHPGPRARDCNRLLAPGGWIRRVTSTGMTKASLATFLLSLVRPACRDNDGPGACLSASCISYSASTGSAPSPLRWRFVAAVDARGLTPS